MMAFFSVLLILSLSTAAQDKEALFFYLLDEVCPHRPSPECCELSVRQMFREKGTYFPMDEVIEEHYFRYLELAAECPEGQTLRHLRCPSSVKWCVPKTDKSD